MKKCIVCLVFVFLLFPSCKNPLSPREIQKILPKIIKFIANVTELKRGMSCTISWEVTGANSVSIDNDIGGVTKTGSKTIDPIETTTYTLTATNNDGTVTSKLKVEVVNGADCYMKNGPIWKEGTYTFSYFGIVRNRGTYKASYVKVYVYLYDANKKLLDYDYTYVDKTDLQPQTESPWEESWWDYPADLRNKIDKSKTEYEIEWSEYTWVYKSGKISLHL